MIGMVWSGLFIWCVICVFGLMSSMFVIVLKLVWLRLIFIVFVIIMKIILNGMILDIIIM